jgi:tagatose 6-phosphate kinase
MITTVTLNAAIDKTYYVAHFIRGESHRTTRMYAEAGGKGINVARTLMQLGERPMTTGFLGGSNGAFISKELQRLGIPHDFVEVNEESRLCLNIIDEAQFSTTEVLESGPTISASELEQIKIKISRLAKQSEIVSFSGSVPKGVSSTIYAELIEIAQKEGARVFLDTSGEALQKGICSLPFFIKPNEKEITDLTGRQAETEEELIQSIGALMEKGITCVTVSLGEQGSITGFEGRIYRAKAPQLQVVNTVGCGDAFVAGMLSGFYRKASIEDCLRLATAAGSANALSNQAGYVRMADVIRIKALVQVQTLL